MRDAVRERWLYVEAGVLQTHVGCVWRAVSDSGRKMEAGSRAMPDIGVEAFAARDERRTRESEAGPEEGKEVKRGPASVARTCAAG